MGGWRRKEALEERRVSESERAPAPAGVNICFGNLNNRTPVICISDNGRPYGSVDPHCAAPRSASSRPPPPILLPSSPSRASRLSSTSAQFVSEILLVFFVFFNDVVLFSFSFLFIYLFFLPLPSTFCSFMMNEPPLCLPLMKAWK